MNLKQLFSQMFSQKKIEKVEDGSKNSRKGKKVYIDNANIYHGQLEAGWQVDWVKLDSYLKNTLGPVQETYLFAAKPDSGNMSNPKENAILRFCDFLKMRLNYVVIWGKLVWRPIKCQACGDSHNVRAEKSVDTALATQLITSGLRDEIEEAIVLTGDQDLLAPICALKQIGVKIRIVGWRSSMAPDLAKESTLPVIYLEDLKDAVSKNKKPIEKPSFQLTTSAKRLFEQKGFKLTALKASVQ